MPLLHLGRNNIAALLYSTGNPYSTSDAVIQISSATSTGFTSTSTSVGGTAFAMVMESGYPTLATNVLTFRGVASTNEANHEWNTWGITNSTSLNTGDFLNRAYEALGEKTASQSWQITAQLTVST